MTVIADRLRAARELIGDPAHWTQGELARDVWEIPLSPRSEGAVRWCVMGAIQRFTENGGEWERARDHLNAVALRLYFVTATTVNDHRGYEATLALMERAIRDLDD